MRRGVLLGLVLALLALGAAAWTFRDRIPGLGREEKMVVSVSPEAAAQAEAKLRALRERGEAARLTENELTSLLRYRLRAQVPGDVYDPAVRLRGDTVRFSGRIPSDRLPPVPQLDRVRAFLPDTADVEISGALEARGGGRAWFDVREVRFAGVPIPARFYPDALRRLGRADQPGLPPTAYPFRLPDGVGEVRVRDGILILEPAPAAER